MIETNLPILYLREVVLLPFNEIRLEFTEDKEKNILENVNRVGEYLGKKLDEIAAGSKVAKEARGMGLMRGLECDAPVGEICAKALDKGLLLLTAGTNVIRFVPPLVIKEEHVDQMAEVLTEVLKEFE